MSIWKSGFEVTVRDLLEMNREVLEKKELPLSFGTEPIRAWRVWRIGGTAEEPTITSTAKTINWTWPARESPAALCVYHHPDLWPTFSSINDKYRFYHTTREPHPAPARHSCNCGYWAMKDKLFPESWSASNAVQYSDLIGEVALWGRVVETEFGYRAQYAYPLNIQFRRSRTIVAEPYRLVDQYETAGLLSEAYGVPVYTWEEAQRFPSHVTQISSGGE